VVVYLSVLRQESEWSCICLYYDRKVSGRVFVCTKTGK
jgi:hypothetical protein